jgi:sulfite reductase beta subunit-like hemoprotein
LPKERFQYGPNLLNRKFKIAFSAIHFDEEKGLCVPDNCVELRTNDIGVAPIPDHDSSGKVRRFQVYIGGSQGERIGYPTFSALGEPFGIFTEDQLLKGLDAIVHVHQEWGDRQNRHWARMKYVLYKMGIEWYRKQVSDRGVSFDPPDFNFEYGARDLHHGWIRQQQQKQQSNNGLLCYGAFIENGRIIDDSPNGQLKKMVRYLMDNYPVYLFTTPNQDLLFTNIPENDKERFEKDMRSFGYGLRNGRTYSQLRVLSGACVGKDTCRLTYTDSEKFEPYLIDELESKWGDMAESIGVTGCEKQCFRPATKTIGWVGTGLNMYMLKLGGTEDGRHQGGSLIDPDTPDKIYLRNVPRKDVVTVTDALFEFYASNRLPEEARPGGMGYFFRRVGTKTITEWLKNNQRTANLMAKPSMNPVPSRTASSSSRR